ncbi:hypothetical protein SOVF_030240 [Spinacia oleracea]|nr:hypothetical protein SOVF_030240 [Spinacia oleracea]
MSEEEGDWFDDKDPLVSEEMAALVHDATNVVPENLNEEEEVDRAEIPDKFHRLMKDAEEELFSGCKTFSRLEFIVTLLHIKHTWHKRLKHGSKECFKGTRMFLEPDHRWRNDKKSFDGEKERRPPPIPLSGDEILEAFDGVPNVIFGKKRKRTDRYLFDQWKKLSIFFRLPYWSKLLIRHNLDVMHIEKNICDSILGTILDIPNKTKDTLKARKDLKEMNVHHNLIPIKIGDKYAIPRAPYQLTSIERRKVLEFLSKVKVPDGYSSNIARCASMEDGKISNMKSHDCHVFLQDLLKPAFQGILPKEVLEPLVELSLFFKQLCSKTLKIDVLEKMEKSIAITLCKLEKVFVPALFDIMVHLPIHLANEAKIAGPVQYRWQYRFER